MITGMWAAITGAAVLLVGVPVAVVLVRRWRHRGQLQPGRDREDQALVVARRHRLTLVEMAQVVQHVGSWGSARPLTDPVLRAATVDRARTRLEPVERAAHRPGIRGLVARALPTGEERSLRRVVVRYGGSAEPVRRPGGEGTA